MPSVFREVSEVPGIARVLYARVSDGEETALRLPPLPDTVALLVVTRGQGSAILSRDGERITEAARPEESVLVVGERVQAYAAFGRVPGAVELQLSAPAEQELSATIIEVTERGRGLLRRFRGSLPCHICKRLVRAAITALLAAMGIPDITLGDEILDELASWLQTDPELPQPLRRVLEWMFDDPGDAAERFIDLLRRFLDGLPIRKAVEEICRALGFCR